VRRLGGRAHARERPWPSASLPLLLVLAGVGLSPPGAGAGFPFLREFLTPRLGWGGSLPPVSLPLSCSRGSSAWLRPAWPWPPPRSQRASRERRPAEVLAGASFARRPLAIDLGHGRSPGCLRLAPIGPIRSGSSSVRRSHPPGTRPAVPADVSVLGHFGWVISAEASFMPTEHRSILRCNVFSVE